MCLTWQEAKYFDHLPISTEYYFRCFPLLRTLGYLGRLCMFIIFHVTVDFALVNLVIDFVVVNLQTARRSLPFLAGFLMLFFSPSMSLRFSFCLPVLFLGLPAFTTIQLIVDLDTQKPTSYSAIVIAAAALLALDDDSRGDVFELDGRAGFVLMIVTRGPPQSAYRNLIFWGKEGVKPFSRDTRGAKGAYDLLTSGTRAFDEYLGDFVICGWLGLGGYSLLKDSRGRK